MSRRMVWAAVRRSPEGLPSFGAPAFKPGAFSHLAGLSIALFSCTKSQPPAPDAAPKPALTVTATVRRNPEMVVSAFVDVDAKGAEYVVVRYGDDATRSNATPHVTVDSAGHATAVLVGLRPGATSSIEVEAHAGDKVARLETQFTTAPLPPDVAIPDVHVEKDDGTAKGFLLGAYNTPKGKIASVYDRKGRTLWYRPLSGEEVGAFSRMPNGHFILYKAPARIFEELDLAGIVVRRWTLEKPASDAGADGHEFFAAPNDRGLVIGWRWHDADSRKLYGNKGVANARRLDNVALDMSPDGTSNVIWSSENVGIDEIRPIPEADIDAKNFEVAHMNAIDDSPESDLYVVTCRDLGQVIGVERATKKVRFRFGGKNGDVKIEGDPLGGPSAVHDARLLPGRKLRVFDNGNGHKVQESRIVVYQLDEAMHGARMIFEYRHAPAIYTWIGGSARDLPDGRLLVDYTWKGVVTEIDEGKKVRWEAKVPQSGAYRIEWIPSLYP